MEGSSEFQRNSSVHLSKEQAQSLEHIGNLTEGGPSRQLNIMRSQDGRYFYELKKDPSRQAVIATLLKGVVPVCDIKRVEDNTGVHYYSYVVPIENEKERGESTAEIEADRQVINLIFDGEHWASKYDLKNVRLDGNHEAVFYDFDRSYLDLKLDKNRVRRLLEYTLAEYPQSLPLIRERILILKNNLDGKSGAEWFNNVLKHTGYKPEEERELSLTYEEFKEREESGKSYDEKYKYRVTQDELLHRLREKIEEALEVLSEPKYHLA